LNFDLKLITKLYAEDFILVHLGGGGCFESCEKRIFQTRHLLRKLRMFFEQFDGVFHRVKPEKKHSEIKHNFPDPIYFRIMIDD